LVGASFAKAFAFSDVAGTVAVATEPVVHVVDVHKTRRLPATTKIKNLAYATAEWW